MKVKATLNLDLTTEEEELLADILSCAKEKLAEKLQPIAKAAIEEYIRMILGQKVFTRGQDIREYRLFLLIKELFQGKIPDDQKISDLFQTTPNESRSLIRSVLSKYQYELKHSITQTLEDIIKNVNKDSETGDLIITVNSISKIEELNRILLSIDGTLPQISKKPKSVSTYLLKRSSYMRLCEHFHIQPLPEE